MILFIGSTERGYFAEEVAQKKQMNIHYVPAETRIEQQKREILSYQNVEYMIIDVSQYYDRSDELVSQIEKIQKTNNAIIIIYGSGFSLKSKLMIDFYKIGVRNYILGSTLTDQKEQLELCLSGYYDVNGLEELETITLQEQKEEQRLQNECTLIGVAGSMSRIGTTTQAIQIVKYLLYMGYKAAYVEMNDTGYVQALSEIYVDYEEDEDIGDLEYMNVHHFYRQDRISEILKKDFDYFVYDFGVIGTENFNKTSFLEKDIKILILGSKPSEFYLSRKIVQNEFYSGDAIFLYNFAPEGDKADILESMEPMNDRTFFPGYSPEPYELVLSNIDIYEKIIPVEGQRKPEKRSFWSKLRGRISG